MPIHDWTRVDAGLFHDFHFSWIAKLSGALNNGALPADYFALLERRSHRPIPDLLMPEDSYEHAEPSNKVVGFDVETDPPQVPLVRTTEACVYANRANRITVRDLDGAAIAVIEIVSPGKKASLAALRRFVEESGDLIAAGLNFLVIDLIPPGPGQQQGVAEAIWEQFDAADFVLPCNKPLSLAAYDVGPPYVAYVQPVAVGDVLPDMPLFLKAGWYVPVPLEATYQAAWAAFPRQLKHLLDG